MFELRVLGAAVLERDGQPLAGATGRRHPLALLALVAMAKARSLSRDRLISLLWPSIPKGTGRNRLTSTLYLLRRQLGPDVLVSSGDSVRLDVREIDCDAWRFVEAVESGDPKTASEIYAGPFLDGFYLDDSPAFEQWTRAERQKLHAMWRDSVVELARAADARADHDVAARRWETLAKDDPLDSAIAREFVDALEAAGKRRQAVDAAEAHAATLNREIGSEAEAEFRRSMDKRVMSAASEPSSPEADGKVGQGLAVLPFEALAGTKDPVLAEGVHSGVLTRLSGVEGLAVIARTSLLAVLAPGLSVLEIAERLGVRWVLEGDVQTAGDQIRVSVRLVDAPADRQSWGQEFVGRVTTADFFDVVARIAGAIVEELRVKLSSRTAATFEKRPTDSLAAYRLCIRGRLRLDQRSPDDMRAALKHFERAVQVDPNYALAWVGIADSIGLLHAYGYADETDLPKAEAAIRKAIDVDSGCAEAHAAYGRLMGQHNNNREAMEALQRAVALKPAFAQAYSWMTIGHQLAGNALDAVRSSQRAVLLDPLSPEALNNLVSSYVFAGRHSDALRAADDARDLDDDYDSAQFFGAIAHYELRNHRAAIEALDDLSVPWAGSGVDSVAAVSLAESRQRKSAQERLKRVRAAGHAFDEGVVLAALGDYDSAVAALNAAIFDGLEFATSYWPSVAARYLFRRVWQTLPDQACHDAMLAKIDSTWK